jgi:1,6-anhydro-N-acetylmuramate kinase
MIDSTVPPPRSYAEGNYLMGTWCADAINSLLEESGVDRASVGLIGSHGQTVRATSLPFTHTHTPWASFPALRLWID